MAKATRKNNGKGKEMMMNAGEAISTLKRVDGVAMNELVNGDLTELLSRANTLVSFRLDQVQKHNEFMKDFDEVISENPDSQTVFFKLAASHHRYLQKVKKAIKEQIKIIGDDMYEIITRHGIDVHGIGYEHHGNTGVSIYFDIDAK